MTTLIKTKFKKSDDQTNTNKNRVTTNITEYHNILKLIFLRVIIPKLRQLLNVKYVCQNVKNQYV